MNINLRLLYLYLFSAVGLIIVVFGCIQLVNLGLKTLVFKEADVYEIYPTPKGPGEVISEQDQKDRQARQARDLSRQRQRDLAGAVSAIAIGLPLYLYHWNTIQKENKKKKIEKTRS